MKSSNRELIKTQQKEIGKFTERWQPRPDTISWRFCPPIHLFSGPRGQRKLRYHHFMIHERNLQGASSNNTVEKMCQIWHLNHRRRYWAVPQCYRKIINWREISHSLGSRLPKMAELQAVGWLCEGRPNFTHLVRLVAASSTSRTGAVPAESHWTLVIINISTMDHWNTSLLAPSHRVWSNGRPTGIVDNAVSTNNWKLAGPFLGAPQHEVAAIGSELSSQFPPCAISGFNALFTAPGAPWWIRMEERRFRRLWSLWALGMGCPTFLN